MSDMALEMAFEARGPARLAPRLYRIEQAGSAPDALLCARIGRLAVKSLYAELHLYPKPGLVSLVDNGSHTDMTAATFMRSLFSLRHYFIRITAAGFQQAPFSRLKQLGIDAEKQMMAATDGVNTHRGAIFCLGMLCAAIGACHARGISLRPQHLRDMLARLWGADLAGHTHAGSASSHGQMAALHHGASGAREEAARCFPSVFDVALPILQQTLAAGRGREAACIDALYALMAHISDTNVYHRAGEQGAALVRQTAQAFLQAGGTRQADWKEHAIRYHQFFTALKLSPGGAADLLAATWLVHEVSHGQL